MYLFKPSRDAGRRFVRAPSFGSALFAALVLAAGAAQAGPVTSFRISGLPASVTAGTSASFTVTAVDSTGAAVPGYTGTVRFSCNYTQTLLPANYTFTAADSGAHQFALTPKEAGTQILDVYDTVSGTVYGETSTSCLPTDASQYVIANLTHGVNLNAGVPASFDITAYDTYWNVATGYAGNAVITSSDPAATLPVSVVFSSGQVTGVQITFWTAGGQSVTATDTVLPSMTDTAWATVDSAPLSTITAPANATTGAAGLVASVASQSGVTYAWTLTGGTISTGQGTSQITFAAGAPGSLVIKCTVTRTASGSSSTGNATVNVVAAPAVPVVSAASPVTAGQTGRTASVSTHAGMTYAWSLSGGTVTSAGGAAGVTNSTAGTNTITYTAPAAGTLTISAVEKNSAGAASAAGTASVQVLAAPVAPVISAPAAVTAQATGITASVVANAGMTYAWTISGGTITSAGGTAGVTSGTTNSLTITAGAAGTMSLSCVEINGAGSRSAAGTKNVTVAAAPQAPVVTAASPVVTGSTGNTARVTARSGMHYSWTLSAGTITSAGGAAGVTSGTTNTITWTAPAAAGTATITCTELNAASASAASAPVQVSVQAASSVPQTPVITAATPQTTGASATAQVTARSGMTYAWTLSGGTITSAGGASGVLSGNTNSIAYTAGAVGTARLTCVESNTTGSSSAPGSANVTVIAAPATPSITAPAQVPVSSTGNVASVAANAGMTYRWTLSPGTITSAGGTSGVTSGSTNTITFTAPGATGPISITAVEVNAAGTASAQGTATVQAVTTPVQPILTGATTVTAGSTGNTVRVTARAGMTYAWTLSGGTITSAGGAAGVTSGSTNSITYTAGAAGSIVAGCTESNAQAQSGPQGTLAITAIAPPVTPVITSASPVRAGATSTASVAANAGMTYAWTLSGGTITSAFGTAGVTSGGTNTITFTAGYGGSLQLGCSEVNAASTASAPASATVSITASSGGTGHLYFVAHQDDDLLFENPALETSIRSGVPTRTVFFTAAGGPDTASWQAREHGIFSSDIAMTHVSVDPYADSAGYWNCAPQTFAGKAVRVCTFKLMPSVSVAFLRLPDGGLSSLWDTDGGAPFYVTPAASLTAYDGSAAYTKAELIATTLAILNDFQPAMIGTTDSTFAYGDDHQDHVTSALFALEAEHSYPRPHQLRIFRGYSMYPNYSSVPLPEIFNLSPAEYQEKHAMMVAYGGGFANGGDYDHWCHQVYSITRTGSGSGPLLTGLGGCAGTQGGATASGTPVVNAACDGTAAQRWTISSDGLVTGPAARCLTVSGPAFGTALTLSDCTGSTAQRFTAFSNGQLRGQNGTCVTVGYDGVSLTADVCSADNSGSLWRVPAAQSLVQQGAPASARSTGTDFSDAEVGTSAGTSGSFALADVNGDGYADACVRRSAGVYCALNDHSGNFGAYSLWSADFSDAAGWQPDAYGSTLRFGDLNGDGKADVCGRGPSGMLCAISSGTGFGIATLWSLGGDFGDAAGFTAGPAYYGSIALGDLNGDGRVDVCGRTASGVVCAVNAGGSGFGAATLWSGSFSDAAGFSTAATGSTLQLGDVNGDGKADVCARSTTGVVCAVASGSAFINSHPWSLRTDFSDSAGDGAAASRYGSIRLGDVNGDGVADVCARGPGGLVCALSHLNGFDTARPVDSAAFTDALGFGADPYGGSLRLGDLTGRGRSDACARGPAGVSCAASP